jgi:hypothetical protein
VNDDELKALMLEAFKVPPDAEFHYPLAPNQWRYLIDRVAEAEREACARVCDLEFAACWHADAISQAKEAKRCADAIRARGESK